MMRVGRSLLKVTVPVGKRHASSLAPIHLLRFPQWQGSGNFEQYQGCHVLADIVAERSQADFQSSVSINDQSLNQQSSQVSHETCARPVLHLEALASHASEAKCSLVSSGRTNVFTVGGDCGVEVAPVSYVNHLWGPGLAVVWFDAHADLNSPASSPSGNFHGMPVRTLLGDGPVELLQSMSSTLEPGQFLYIGTRDVDPQEKEFMDKHNMFSQRHLDLKQLCNKLAGFDYAYLHVDLDVLDPCEFPFVACPTPDGFSVGDLLQGIEQVAEVVNVVGCSLTECCAQKRADVEALSPVVDALMKALRKPKE